MISSGTKRGLAAVAVSALAVAGLPFLASSASAAAGDEIVFGAAGPTRDNATAAAFGGVIVLKVKGLTDADAANVKAIGTDLSGSANNANQTIVVNNAAIPALNPDSSADVFGADGYQELYVPVKVDTATTGGTATYALFVDDNNDGIVQAGEARVQVSQSTSGDIATVSVDPLAQTAPSGIDSGNYTATLKDSAGRTTQALQTEGATIDPADATTKINGGAAGATLNLNAGTAPSLLQRGNFTFKASDTNVGRHNIDVSATGSSVSTVSLDVVAAASGITNDEVDFVTGADSWDGFGGDTYANGVTVRTDQASVKLDIKSPSNAGKVVSVTTTGSGLTFGGQAAKTQTVTLNGSGVGELTFTPDAGTIQSGDSFTVVGGGINTTVTYAAPAVTATTVTPDATTYLSSYGGSVTATVTVTDQFGTPAAGTYVTVQRTGGANADATESARKVVGADGKVSFTLTDTKATAASHASDTLNFKVYAGQFDNTALATDSSSHIDYTATGTGSDFFLTVDGQLPAGPAYDPNTVFANPLTDADADNFGDSGDEYVTLNITGGNAGAPVTVTADNGALVLKGTKELLSDAAASRTGELPATGANAFRIVGTKTGLVNVTVTSGGVSHTAVVSIHTDAESATPTGSAAGTARNIAVTGPEKAEAGDSVTFTAKVTDAFGNPVYGVPASAFAGQVSGPGSLLGSTAKTDKNGEIVFTVGIDDDADRAVSLSVRGTGGQFGAAANRYDATSTTDDATGLTASVATASASIADVVNIEQLKQAVADAQAAVDVATNNVQNAKGDLSVAKTQQKVAKKAVTNAKKALKKAKKHHKGVNAAKKDLNDAKGDKQIADAQVKAAQKKVTNAQATLATAKQKLADAQQALEDAQSDS